MIKKLQYYVSNTVNPHLNLATEKDLFDTVDHETLILYLWQNQNTVVIGKNQNAFSECRVELLKKEGGTLARRLSGGGAVFHDLGNLNFTFLCATENLDVSKHLQVIGHACRLAGIETERSGRNDLLANGRKFSGNAFYNSQGHSYHHGTLLVNADMEKLNRYLTPPKAKLEAKGIKSVRSRVINLCELAPSLTCDAMTTYLLTAAESVFGVPPQAIDTISQEKIETLAEQFRNWDYLYGSPIPCNVSCGGQLPFGNVDLKLCVKNGHITDLKLYTDALDSEISVTVQKALLSLPFDLTAISEALPKHLGTADANALIALLSDQIFS
ncbi:MAG: lipoate--protein ligase [Ruminococcaceae bacterium]|nr:lipoate--protein ligase [Oscillospiraceae bacterium]